MCTGCAHTHSVLIFPIGTSATLRAFQRVWFIFVRIHEMTGNRNCHNRVRTLLKIGVGPK